MDYKEEIEKLSKKICCKSNKFYDSFENFPTTGKVNTLYIDKSTGSAYIWNGIIYITGGAPSNVPKVYKALVSQSGTNAPTAVVLENTLGSIPTFTREDLGVYTIQNTSFVDLDKIIFKSEIRASKEKFIKPNLEELIDNKLKFESIGFNVDFPSELFELVFVELLNIISIEIEVYP